MQGEVFINGLRYHLTITSNEGKPSSVGSKDEVDKGTNGGKRVSRFRNAVSKAREKLKRDTSNSGSSSDSENLSTSEEDIDLDRLSPISKQR